MFLTDYVTNMVALQAAKRRAEWELERLAALQQQVREGKLTEKEALNRLRD